MTAAVFVVCKADVRHTQLLVRVVDASLVALRAMQQRPLEPQYFKADGVRRLGGAWGGVARGLAWGLGS